MESKAKQNLSHPHDLLVRSFLSDRDLAANFFINYLSLEWTRTIDYDSMKREPSDSINRDFAELIGDLLYSAKFKGTGQDLRVFMLLEHQSRPDRFMSFRLLKYVCAAYQQYYGVAFAVHDESVLTPKRPGTGSQRFSQNSHEKGGRYNDAYTCGKIEV